jgi:hypothetical protein
MAVSSNIEEEARDAFPYENLGPMVRNVLSFAMSIGALLTLGYFIWGAIQYITAEGDKSRVEEARQKMTHALIGLALLVSVWALWQLAIKFFGLGTTGDTVILEI